jgi:hypothetical protein
MDRTPLSDLAKSLSETLNRPLGPIQTASVTTTIINTSQLANRVLATLGQLNISILQLARTQKISRTYMKHLLTHPAPWHTLSAEKMRQYSRMNEWLEEKEQLLTIGWNSIDNNSKPKSLDVIEADRPNLNTADVARQIVNLLEANGIGEGFFARKVLRITKAHFDELVVAPKQWVQLDEGDRDLFRRLYTWTRVSPVEIDDLRREYEARPVWSEKNKVMRRSRKKARLDLSVMGS